MTFVPVNFDEVIEPAPVTPGIYNLQITRAEVKQTGERSKNPGRDQIVVGLVFTGTSEEELNAPAITHYISVPHPDDEPKTAKFKARMLKRFLEVFNVPYESNGIDLEKAAMDMTGAEAELQVSLSAPDDNGNVYNRIVLPPLNN